MGPVTVAEVTVDASTLHDGDFAGLAAFQGCYSYIALTRRNGRTMLTVQYKPVNDDSIFFDNDWDSPAVTDAEIMAMRIACACARYMISPIARMK